MRFVMVVMGLLTIFGLGPVAGQSDKATGEVCKLKVEGMACSACAARVEKQALKVDGVKAAKVDQPKGIASVTFDPTRTSPSAIAKAVASKTGFKTEVQEPRQH
jgi:copper chaperone CopZ